LKERNGLTVPSLATVPRLAKKSVSPSSKQWLARHFDDPYVRQRLSHPASYRSRSAFKLLEIDDRYRRFLRAPGGWSQVVAGFMGSRGETWDHGARVRRRKDQPHGDGRWGLRADARSGLWSDSAERVEEEIESGSGNESGGRGVVVAVDRLRIPPIPGVHTLQADFLVPETALMLEAIIRAKANPDGKMEANATGNRTRDTGFTRHLSPVLLSPVPPTNQSESWAIIQAQTFRPPRVATIS